MKYTWKKKFPNHLYDTSNIKDEPDNAICISEFSVAYPFHYIIPDYYTVMQDIVICTKRDTECEVKNRYFPLSVIKVVVYRNDGHFGDFDHHLNNCCETRKAVNLQLLRSKQHGLNCGLTF